MKFKHELVELDQLKAATANGKRFYETPEGDSYPSVTTITGLLSREGIQAWRLRVGEEVANKITKAATTRGTKVHKLAEMYLRNELVLQTSLFDEQEPIIGEMFNQLSEELDKHVGTIKAIEAPLYSNALRVGGTVDLVAEWDGILSVIDLKTSSKPKKVDWIDAYFMQCAAYAMMWEERTGISISQVVIPIAVEKHDVQIFYGNQDNYIEQFKDLRTKFDIIG
jgi:genome maintenance exonuclease 1